MGKYLGSIVEPQIKVNTTKSQTCCIMLPSIIYERKRPSFAVRARRAGAAAAGGRVQRGGAHAARPHRRARRGPQRPRTSGR